MDESGAVRVLWQPFVHKSRYTREHPAAAGDFIRLVLLGTFPFGEGGTAYAVTDEVSHAGDEEKP